METELDKRFLYTKTKRPYTLEVLYKMLKDQCEAVNVIGEKKLDKSFCTQKQSVPTAFKLYIKC